jgi:hypothetical protein
MPSARGARAGTRHQDGSKQCHGSNVEMADETLAGQSRIRFHKNIGWIGARKRLRNGITTLVAFCQYNSIFVALSLIGFFGAPFDDHLFTLIQGTV